jgi:hypothetical protein
VQCRLGAAYAGDGIGIFLPMQVGDEVNVEIPRGNINDGPIVGFRTHGPMALPPSDWSGTSVLIISDGAIRLEGPDVTAGAHTGTEEDPADAALLGSSYLSAEDQEVDALVTGFEAISAAFSALSGLPGMSGPMGIATAAMTELGTALAEFQTSLGLPPGAPGALVSDSFKVGK